MMLSAVLVIMFLATNGVYAGSSSSQLKSSSPVVSAKACKGSKRSLQLLSFTKEEQLKTGDKITFRWKTCSISKNAKIALSLQHESNPKTYSNGQPLYAFPTTKNDGQETLVIPSLPTGTYQARAVAVIDVGPVALSKPYIHVSNNTDACTAKFPAITLQPVEFFNTNNTYVDVHNGRQNVLLGSFTLQASPNCSLQVERLVFGSGGLAKMTNLRLVDQNKQQFGLVVPTMQFSGKIQGYLPIVFSTGNTYSVVPGQKVTFSMYGDMPTLTQASLSEESSERAIGITFDHDQSIIKTVQSSIPLSPTAHFGYSGTRDHWGTRGAIFDEFGTELTAGPSSIDLGLYYRIVPNDGRVIPDPLPIVGPFGTTAIQAN